jgi:hypothetical protein
VEGGGVAMVRAVEVTIAEVFGEEDMALIPCKGAENKRREEWAKLMFPFFCILVTLIYLY